MAGNRSGAILPDLPPVFVAARVPASAAAREANRAGGATPAARVIEAGSGATTTTVTMRAATGRRMPVARAAADARFPVAGSAVIDLEVRSGPIVAAATNGTDRRGSVIAGPTGRADDRDSEPRAHGRVRRRIVPADRGRSRVRTVTGGITIRGSAAISGLRDALDSAIPIGAATSAVPDARMVVAAPTTVVSVAVGRPSGPTAARIGPGGIVSSRVEAATDRQASPAPGERPGGHAAAAVKVAVAAPIDVRRGRRSRTCPTRSRPAISICPSDVTC